MNTGKRLVPVLMLATLSGCATQYPIAKNYCDQAAPLTISQVNQDPKGTQGTMVIWGGTIVSTVNDTNGGAIYIMKMPLLPDGEPRRNSLTDGAFIATSTQPLDTESYSYGCLVTVAGKVIGTQPETLENTQYACPVLDIQDIHVWPLFPNNFVSYGTPAWFVGPNWWWHGGNYHPPRYYDAGFSKGYGE